MSTKIANTSASILNQTVLTAAQAQAITGLLTYTRAPNAPFAVQAGSAKVTNLDADLLDGQEGSYYNNVANLTGTTLPASIIASSLTSVGTITSGTWNSAVASAGLTGVFTVLSGIASIQVLGTGSPTLFFTNVGGGMPGGGSSITYDNAGNFYIQASGIPKFQMSPAGALTFVAHKAGTPSWAAGDKYLVVDANGNVHVSALGPAS